MSASLESDPTPSEIVQSLQALADIEGDLADAASAVAMFPTEGITDATSGDALLQNAQAIEQVLEQNIPPGPETKELTPAAEQVSLAAVRLAPPSNDAQPVVPAPLPTPDLPVAPEAFHTVDAASADLSAPTVPEIAISAAEDVTADSHMEADTSPMRIEIESSAEGNVAAAVAGIEILPSTGDVQPLPGGVGISVSPRNVVASHTNGHDSAIQPVGDASAPATPSRIPVQTPYTSLFPPKATADLPEGLTITSPSVVSNPDLIRTWRSDPRNPTLLLSLFNWAVQKTEINDARVWHNALAVHEPTAIHPLLALVNLELALSHFAQVETLFGRALKGSESVTAAADVSVWKAYLHYIRRQNPVTESAGNVEQVRTTVTQAYEFALKECGTDRESGEVWQEYVSFLADYSPKNTWETQQQVDTLRKIYHRAICIPLNNVEALWKAYDAFESSNNKLTAKKFLAERSPAYMTARTALRELRSLTDVLPKLILPAKPTFSEEDRRSVTAWKAYLKWEEGNPLVIEDQEVLHGRIAYALRKCLGEMRHFPELWHYAAHFHAKIGKKDESAELLKAGVQACPNSVLLAFAFADLEEERKNLSECHIVYEKLLLNMSSAIEDLKSVVIVEVDAARGPEIPLPANNDDIIMDGPTDAELLVEERETRGKLVEERRGKDVAELATAAGVVWIMYMRFARRAEGIKAARGVFGKARRSIHTTWHIFEASAMMEYHSNKDSSVAIRIFELGWKLFSEEVEYVVRYLQFLLSINDDTNARALFERSALKIPIDKARPLWDAWARYEYMWGDLSAVHKLEARFAEFFPNDSPLKRFAQRFTYNGIDEIAIRDLGFGRMSRQPPAQPPLAPQPLISSPSIKRSLPDSPRPSPRRNIDDRSRSPPPQTKDYAGPSKRYRQSYSPPRRFPPPERERIPSGGGGGGGGGRYGPPQGRDRSPMPQQPRRDDRGPSLGAPPPGPPISGGQAAPSAYDRSGLPQPLAWFIGSLPTSRAFDGPIFRPDDIMHLFSNISPAAGLAQGPAQPPVAVPARSGYAETGRYGGLPAIPGQRY